jgi:hypothetical protein
VRDDTFSAEAAVCSPGRVKPKKRHRGCYGTFVTLSLMLALFASIPARAEPRSIQDCEKIQAADAYNQCLASFGPVAHEHNVKADPEGSGGGGQVNGNVSKAASRRHGGHVSHGSHARGYQHQTSRHQASGHSKHADPWAHMRRAGAGRKRAEFKVRHH